MNKKIMIVSILSVFMLLAIAFASTVTSDTSKPSRKESPLFGIRTRKAIREKIGDLMRRFVGERVFFLPFYWLRNAEERPMRERLADKTDTPGYDTCYQSCSMPIICTLATDCSVCD